MGVQIWDRDPHSQKYNHLVPEPYPTPPKNSSELFWNFFSNPTGRQTARGGALLVSFVPPVPTPTPTQEVARTLVQVFIRSHLDYCNSLLHAATWVLLLPGHVFGTAFQHTCAKRTLPTTVSGVDLKHTLTYLLTYRQWCSGKFGVGGTPGGLGQSPQRGPGQSPSTPEAESFFCFWISQGGIFHLTTSKFRKLRKPHIFQVTSD